MPSVYRYRVIEEREVTVTAEDPIEAVNLAKTAFKNAELVNAITPATGGRVSEVRIVSVHSREDF